MDGNSFDMYPPEAGNPNIPNSNPSQQTNPQTPPQNNPSNPPDGHRGAPPHSYEESPIPQGRRIPGFPTGIEEGPEGPLPPTPQQGLMGAMEAHYLALKARSIANLNNYMLSPVGVAEHPDVVAEAIKLMENINHADGMLQTLRRVVSQ